MTNAQEARIKAESILKDKRKELVKLLDELEDKMQNAFAEIEQDFREVYEIIFDQQDEIRILEASIEDLNYYLDDLEN